jgi:hypothetical protein
VPVNIDSSVRELTRHWLNQVCEIHIRLQLDQMAATPGVAKLSANGELKNKISETKDLG